MMKYVRMLLVAFLVIVLAACGNNKNINEGTQTEDLEPLIQVEEQVIPATDFTNLNDEVENIKDLEEGTIIVRFNYIGESIMTLFSLSDNTKNANHFNLYISPTAIGHENRNNDENLHVHTELDLKQRQDHTLALVADKENGYKYFLNGELVHTDHSTDVNFLSNISNPNSAQLGQTERAEDGNPYPFNGEIISFILYDQPIADEALLELTGETAETEDTATTLPDHVHVTEPTAVFYPGFMDSKNYRIPALLYTKKGTLIAGIDRRVKSGADSPNDIDAMIRRSFDQGETWEENGIIINEYEDENASNIDLAFVQDQNTERIFALVDGWPSGAGLMDGNTRKGSGFVTINGNRYMFLTDEDGNEYTIREEGVVFDADGNETNYTVDLKRNLLENGEKVSNIFNSDAPLKAFKTSYLELYYSDDEGETWTGPFELNGQVKEDWMSFLGTGPGNGIQLTQEPYKGRLVFPVYFFNDRSKQASAVIYSDDNGKTWHRGQSPNEGREAYEGVFVTEKDFAFNDLEITEAQVVEMPDGQLKMFMRNRSGRAQIATSLDGGETWLPEVVKEEALVAPYSQMTVIRYNGEIDGKQAVIFASANNPRSRIDGTVRIGLIEEDGTYENGRTKYKFDWKYEQLVKEGQYGYSSLADLGDGNIGLLYEGTPDTVMDYIQFNIDFIKWDRAE